MAVFSTRFYNGRDEAACDVDGYRRALEQAYKYVHRMPTKSVYCAKRP